MKALSIIPLLLIILGCTIQFDSVAESTENLTKDLDRYVFVKPMNEAVKLVTVTRVKKLDGMDMGAVVVRRTDAPSTTVYVAVVPFREIPIGTQVVVRNLFMPGIAGESRMAFIDK